MTDGNPESAGEPGRRTLLEERVSADKRQFLKLVLGSMTAYSVPLMTSFSTDGLQVSAAAAGTTFGGNQTHGGFFGKILEFLARLFNKSRPG